MKKLIMTVALLMLVVGATIAVLKFLEMGPFELTQEQKVERQKEIPAADLDEEARLIDMDPMIIPIFDGDQVAATIHIQVKLETSGTKNSIKLNNMKPRLADSFLKELYAYIPRMLRQDGHLDLGKIKTRLLMVSDRYEHGLITDVLIQSVNQREGRP